MTTLVEMIFNTELLLPIVTVLKYQKLQPHIKYGQPNMGRSFSISTRDLDMSRPKAPQ